MAYVPIEEGDSAAEILVKINDGLTKVDTAVSSDEGNLLTKGEDELPHLPASALPAAGGITTLADSALTAAAAFECEFPAGTAGVVVLLSDLVPSADAPLILQVSVDAGENWIAAGYIWQTLQFSASAEAHAGSASAAHIVLTADSAEATSGWAQGELTIRQVGTGAVAVISNVFALRNDAASIAYLITGRLAPAARINRFRILYSSANMTGTVKVLDGLLGATA
jgi:hypothetical protein